MEQKDKNILIIVGLLSVIGIATMFPNESETDKTKQLSGNSEQVSNETIQDTEKVNEEQGKTDTVETSTEFENETISDTIFAGEQGIIVKDVLFALGNDKKNLEELMDYVTANDSELVNQLILDGKVILVPVNTPITVIENDFLTVHLKINETGEIGWVPYEYVGKPK